MRTIAFFSLILGLSACATPPVPPNEVMAEATRIILTDTQWPAKGDEATRWVRDKVLIPVDATPNTDPDWMIDPDRSETAGMLCGTGGCEIQIWSRNASGRYVPVFVSRVRDLKIVHKDEAYRLKVDYHGSHCGLTGAEPCPATYVWQGEVTRLGIDPEVGFHNELRDNAVTLAPIMQALPSTEGLPAEVAELLSSAHAACAQRGRKFDASQVVNRIPDTNGDGIREWAWDGLYAQCEWQDGVEAETDPCAGLTCENRIYASQRVGGELKWVRIPLNPASPYGLKTCSKGLTEIVELASEVSSSDCDCSSQCRQKTLSPIPNVVE